MRTILPAPFLKRALLADATVSSITGLLQLAATDGLVALLGFPRLALVGTGEFMLIYAALLLVRATRKRLWSPAVGVIVLGNLLWGLGGLAFLVSGLVAPSAAGTAFVLLQVAAVALFAGLEWTGLRRSAPAASGSSAPAVGVGRHST